MKGILLGCCVWCNLFCLNASVRDAEWTRCEKAYVKPAEIHFVENDIFIHLGDNQWIQAEAISTDSAGLFVSSFKPVDGVWFSWTCGNCGKNNEGYRDCCKKCAASRPS